MNETYFSNMNVETSVVDNSIMSPVDNLTLSLLPLLVGGFSSKGEYHKVTQLNGLNTALSVFGSDFEDLEKYGQQNLNLAQYLRGGGSAFFVRLLHEESAKQANRLFKIKFEQVDDGQLYERDGYGQFVVDENNQKKELKYIKDPDGAATETNVQVPSVKITISSEYVENSTPSSAITEENDGKTITVPLMFISSNTKGLCGNNFGIVIDNDFARDDMVSDGRRYSFKTYELTASGNTLKSSTYFSFNPESVQSSTSTTSESLNLVYSNLDSVGRKRDVQLTYFVNNYPTISNYINKYLETYQEFLIGLEGTDDALLAVLKGRTDYSPSSALDTDFINCLTKEQLPYDNFFIGTPSVSLSTNIVLMTGGEDGWVGNIGSVVTNPFVKEVPDRGTDEGSPITLTGDDVTKDDWKYGVTTDAFLEKVHEQLLVSFYNCDIPSLRSEILSVYKCPAGLVADANYPMSVKKAIIEFAKLRKDISVVFDGRLDSTNLDIACSTSKNLMDLVGSDNDPFRFTCVPFIGTSVNTTKRNRVTATYEYCYDIAKVYASNPFSIIAGYQNQFGAVRTMVMDWVVEEDKPRGSQFKKARENNIIYPVDMAFSASSIAEDNVTGKKYYWMSNRSFYPIKTSKLSEFRNGIIVADVQRVAILVLARFTYDSTTAEANMAKAKRELDEQISTRYPSDVTFETTFTQTDHDRLTNSCSVTIAVTFPDIIETYRVTVSAERAS